MMGRVRENDLKLPALYVIWERGQATTTEIKDALVELFRPTGEDGQILAGRNDTKFTQKVRNLMGSHYETNGMADLAVKDRLGRFTLTAAGERYLAENEGDLERVFSRRAQGALLYGDTVAAARALDGNHGDRGALLILSEEETVAEGGVSRVQRRARQRSRRLRAAAVQYYGRNGRIRCAACGFDFWEVYGELGEGYIQIHHEEPLFLYEEEGIEDILRDALQRVKPLCANCHCMIHRWRDAPLSVEELRALIRQRS